MVVTNILNAEVAKKKYTHNGASFVAPKPRHGGGFVVARFIKERAE